MLNHGYKIIGLGGIAGSGKSLAAELITDYLQQNCAGAWAYMPFAYEVKRIAYEQFGWDGKKDEKGRALLQAIGSAGRAYDPDIWVNKVRRYADTYPDILAWLIIDDVRYPNECDWINSRGAAIQLTRIGAGLEGAASEHESERSVAMCKWAYSFSNDLSHEYLRNTLVAELRLREIIP